MKTAFDFRLSPPAPRADVFSRLYGRGARDASDRKIIFGNKRMTRQVERIKVVRNLLCRPMCERIDLDAAALGIEQSEHLARAALESFAASDPGVITFEGFRQGQDLADLAAAVRIARPQKISRVFHRKQRGFWLESDDICKTKKRHELVPIGKGFLEQELRIDEQNRHRLVDLRG